MKLLAVLALGSSIIVGGSNLGMRGYPTHMCINPVKGDYTADRYAEHYKRYRDCMAEYIANAKNDARHINGLVEEAEAELRDSN